MTIMHESSEGIILDFLIHFTGNATTGGLDERQVLVSRKCWYFADVPLASW